MRDVRGARGLGFLQDTGEREEWVYLIAMGNNR